MSSSPPIHNGTCPGSQAIESYLPGIPSNVTAIVIPGQNISGSWMVACCKPYPAQLTNSCWEWCEIVPDVASKKSDADISRDFNACLDANHRDSRLSSVSMLIRPTPSAPRAAGMSWGMALLGAVMVAGYLGTVQSGP